jgi:hypothetical protein
MQAMMWWCHGIILFFVFVRKQRRQKAMTGGKWEEGNSTTAVFTVKIWMPTAGLSSLWTTSFHHSFLFPSRGWNDGITTTTTALTCCFVLSCIRFLRPLSLIYPFVCGAVLVMATREQQRRPQTLNLALGLAQTITEIQLTFTCFTSCFLFGLKTIKEKRNTVSSLH